MANSVSASASSSNSIEKLNIEQKSNTGAVESNSDLLSDFDSKSIKAKLSKSAEQDGLPGLIKAFASLIKDLVNSLSTVLENFSAKLPKKKEKTTTVDKTVKATKKQITKETNQNKKSGTTSSAKKATEAAKTEPKTAVPSSEQLSAPQGEEVSTPIAAPDTAIKIDPKEGYSDDNLSVATNKQGSPEVYTEDGYIVRFEGTEQAWQIVDPEGKVNRIWGDPHVIESDGDTWDFKERSTFLFGNNKVSVETVPYGNGQTLSSRVTIYNGNSRVSVSGIEINKPIFEAISKDGVLDDALRDDGDIFILGKEENGEREFILLKDVGEKFDQNFGKQVGVGNDSLIKKYLNEQQLKL